MIILRVAMGHGWRTETVNRFNTAPVFTNSTPDHEQSQATPVTIHITEDPISEEHSNMSESCSQGVTRRDKVTFSIFPQVCILLKNTRC
jgi:hypothetical protein